MDSPIRSPGHQPEDLWGFSVPSMIYRSSAAFPLLPLPPICTLHLISKFTFYIIMATATTTVKPSFHAHVESDSDSISAPAYSNASSTPKVDADKAASEWVSSLNTVLQSGDFDGLSKLFHKESYWRDQLCLSWDYHTLQGPDKMISFLKGQSQGCRIKWINVDKSSGRRGPNIAPVDFRTGLMGVQSFLKVETDVGRGRGLVRLLPDVGDSMIWKACNLFTTTHELKGHEEVSHHEHNVVDHDIKAHAKSKLKWMAEEEPSKDASDPTCLIIGMILDHLTYHPKANPIIQVLVKRVSTPLLDSSTLALKHSSSTAVLELGITYEKVTSTRLFTIPSTLTALPISHFLQIGLPSPPKKRWQTGSNLILRSWD
jgi:hypothetical protein